MPAGRKPSALAIVSENSINLPIIKNVSSTKKFHAMLYLPTCYNYMSSIYYYIYE